MALPNGMFGLGSVIRQGQFDSFADATRPTQVQGNVLDPFLERRTRTNRNVPIIMLQKPCKGLQAQVVP